MASIDKNSNQEETIVYKTFPINYSLRPKYYDDFQCKAQNCKFTCCAGWKITMSRKDYLKMRSQHGSEQLNQNIKQALQKIKNGQGEHLYAEIRCKEDGYCPLVTEEGLCRLQVECGYDVLPYICKIFPRGELYSSSLYKEQSLSLACEAVLELLWDLPEGIIFVSDELPQEEKRLGHYPISSPNLYFQDVRSLCIDLLQDRRFSLRQRILLLGIFLQKLPLDATEIPQWCRETKLMIESPELAELSKNLCIATEETTIKYLLQNIQTVMNLSQGGTIYSPLQEYAKKLLHHLLLSIEPAENDEYSIHANIEFYQKCKDRFYKNFGDIEYFFENMMVSLWYQETFPNLASKEKTWTSYVRFCNIYSLIRFISITSCTEDVEEPREQLFEAILFVARDVFHNMDRYDALPKSFLENESDSLAHMAILLSE